MGKREGGPLATTAANADAVDDDTLLSAVAEAARLVGASRAGEASDGLELAVLPAAHAEKEAHGVRLFLLPELLEVFVRT